MGVKNCEMLCVCVCVCERERETECVTVSIRFRGNGAVNDRADCYLTGMCEFLNHWGSAITLTTSLSSTGSLTAVYADMCVTSLCVFRTHCWSMKWWPGSHRNPKSDDCSSLNRSSSSVR